jgi:hypothetical protein
MASSLAHSNSSNHLLLNLLSSSTSYLLSFLHCCFLSSQRCFLTRRLIMCFIVSFLYVDWKLMFPRLEVLCPVCLVQGKKCNLYMETRKTTIAKDKSLFPIWAIWGHRGIPTWTVLTRYKCVSCKLTLLTNDALLLFSLPAHVQSLYPVQPKYGTGTFHFHQDLTFNLELLMRTYANARFVSNRVFRKLGQQYTVVV